MLTKTNDQVMLTDKWYKIGKKLVQIILPAFSALYFGLAAIWGLPAAEQVVGTVACVTTFFGVCLNISSSNYQSSGAALEAIRPPYDGEIVVTEPGDGVRRFELQLDGDPNDITDKESVTFKVVGDPVLPIPPENV